MISSIDCLTEVSFIYLDSIWHLHKYGSQSSHCDQDVGHLLPATGSCFAHETGAQTPGTTFAGAEGRISSDTTNSKNYGREIVACFPCQLLQSFCNGQTLLQESWGLKDSVFFDRKEKLWAFRSDGLSSFAADYIVRNGQRLESSSKTRHSLTSLLNFSMKFDAAARMSQMNAGQVANRTGKVDPDLPDSLVIYSWHPAGRSIGIFSSVQQCQTNLCFFSQVSSFEAACSPRWCGCLGRDKRTHAAICCS